MNRNLVCLLLIVFSLFACKQHKKNINQSYKPSDIAVITTLAFDATIPSDTLFKQSLSKQFNEEDSLNNPALKQGNYDQARKTWLDTQKRMLESDTVYAVLWDTLFKLPSTYLTSFLSGIKKEKIDSSNPSYYKFLSEWAPGILISAQPNKFNLEDVAFDYGYSYRLKSQLKTPKNKVLAEGFQMSPVFFNVSKNKAFVLTERKRHYTLELFFEKKLGRWQIVKNEMVRIY